MGSSTSNVVFAGTPLDAASSLGSLTITGTTSLTVDDSDDANGVTATLTSDSLSLGDSPLPTFDYSGASLQYLEFNGGTTAADTVFVDSMPDLPAGSPMDLLMGNSTSNAVNLGDSTHAASSLGDVTVTGNTGLSIDDSADTTDGQTVKFTGGQATIGGSQTIDYSGATLSSLTFKAGSGGTAATVDSTPSSLGATALVLRMGTSSQNSVDLGGGAASALGDVTINGDTGLEVNDSNSSGSDWTISVTGLGIGFSNGTTSNNLDYSDATLSSLSLNTNNQGGNVVNVTGMPSLPEGSPMQIGTFTNFSSPDVPNAINLGDSTHAASGLGSIDLSTTGDGTTTLSIDDFAGAGDETVGVSSTAVTFGPGGPTFDYTGQPFASVTIDTSNPGGTTLDDTGAPAAASGLAPLILDLGAGGPTTIDLGDADNAASGLGDVTITSAGTRTDLTIDDTADTSAATVSITADSLSFGAAPLPAFTYTDANLSGMTFDAGSDGSNTLNVTGEIPGGSTGTLLTLAMGSGTGNQVNLGDPSNAASGLASTAITGSTGLTIDDSADGPSSTINATSAQVNFGLSGPTFDYSEATLTGLTFDTPGAGSSTVNITGSPAAASGLAPITLNMGPGTGNSIKLGDATHAADALGNVTVTTSGSAPDPGTTGLEVDDAAGDAGQTIDVGSGALVFTDGPTFNYVGAKLVGLTLDAGTAGGNAITVTGSPELVGLPTTIKDAAPSDSPDAIMIGDAADPASGLAGNVVVDTGRAMRR